jgi:hypothetical protein
MTFQPPAKTNDWGTALRSDAPASFFITWVAKPNPLDVFWSYDG